MSMINTARRGFLKLVAAAPIAAPVIAKEAAAPASMGVPPSSRSID